MKQVLFFRSERHFKTPRAAAFGCLGDTRQVQINQIDIGDNIQEINHAWERIESEINRLLGYIKFDKEIYVCGAVPVGFAWLLRGFLASRFSEVRFIWLQMARQKGVDYDVRKYEVWE